MTLVELIFVAKDGAVVGAMYTRRHPMTAVLLSLALLAATALPAAGQNPYCDSAQFNSLTNMWKPMPDQNTADLSATELAAERKIMRRVLRARAIRLPKLVVEEHFADAGNIRQHAVKNLALHLILVEAQSRVLAQIPATLRITKGQYGLDTRGRRMQRERIGVASGIMRLVAQECHQISRCRVTNAKDFWVSGRIPEVIDHPWLERGAVR